MTVIATVNDTFDHPADKVWPEVANFGGIDKYFRSMPPLRVVGTGLGQERGVPMGDGEVVERLTWLDEDAMAFSYTIISGPVPFRRYVACVKLTPKGEQTDIFWQGTFDVDGVTEAEGETMALGIYNGLIKGIKRTLAG